MGIAAYPAAELIPQAALGAALEGRDRNREIVLACRSGARSARAVRQLQAAGFTKVWNLAGGILRWADEVDPSITKY